MDNFDAVDLSWVKSTMDPLEVLKHSLDFLQDPSKINSNNREIWCNLHITPALEGIMVEVNSLEEVTYWAKKGCLGSDPDPTEPGVANLIVAFGISPWPCTLSLARVHVALNQRMCSIIEAMESAREHFSRKKGLKVAYYYLTPVYTEAPYILSDAGLQATDGSATIIGVAMVGIVPKDNTVNLTTSEGALSTLVICCLFHLRTNLVLVPPQLSCPKWTGMRRVKIWYESFICFTALYAPPNILESECNTQQLALMEGLCVPKSTVLLALANQLENLRAAPPEPKVSNPESWEGHGTKDETIKQVKLVDIGDTPRKHHKSCEEKSQSKHSLMEKSPASSSCGHDVVPQAGRLGNVVAQACLSVARMVRVVEKTHNSKTAEALIVRQCLEKVSAEAIDSVMDEIQGAHTPADMWQVEKISAHISHERAKAYSALIEQHHSMPDHLTGKDGSGNGSSKMVDVEEEFSKSISTLISTVITEGAKIPGEHGMTLTSSIFWLVPTLPLDLVIVPSIDLPPEKECKITLGDVLQPFPAGHGATSSLPSSPLTGGVSAPMVTGRSTIKFGQAVIQPVTFAPPTMDYSFFKKPVSTNVPAPQRGWGAPSASSSPLLKEPHTSPPDTPDITKSLTDPLVLTKDDDGNDDDDGMLTPGKTDPSNIRDGHKGSKQ